MNETAEIKTLTDRLAPEDEFRKFCDTHEKIYIYSRMGAQKTIALLSLLEGMRKKASGIILQKAREDATIFGGYKPYSLPNIELSENDGVIISSSEKDLLPIMELEIKSKGFNCGIFIEKPVEMDIPNIFENNNEESTFFERFTELDLAGTKYGTYKSSSYYDHLRKYELFFQYFRDEEIKIMELGVFEGASIHTFDGKESGGYFKNAIVIGIDTLEACQRYMPNPNHFYRTDLSYEDNLTELKKIEPTIIIDDASHMWSHQIKALFILWDSLPKGGMYIIEGIDTSFTNAGFKGFNDAIVSAFEICRDIAELATGGAFLDDENNHPFAEETKKIAKEVDMITFIKGACIMIKK